MPGSAKVTAGAFNPTVVVENNVAAVSALLERLREEERTQFYVDQVARMQRKLDRVEGEVAAAREALVTAEAELEAEQARVARVIAERERIEALPEDQRELARQAARDQEAAERAARRARDAEARARAKAAAASN